SVSSKSADSKINGASPLHISQPKPSPQLLAQTALPNPIGPVPPDQLLQLQQQRQRLQKQQVQLQQQQLQQLLVLQQRAQQVRQQPELAAYHQQQQKQLMAQQQQQQMLLCQLQQQELQRQLNALPLHQAQTNPGSLDSKLWQHDDSTHQVRPPQAVSPRVEPLQAMMVDAAGAVDIPAELADEDIDRMVAELLENDTDRLSHGDDNCISSSPVSDPADEFSAISAASTFLSMSPQMILTTNFVQFS
ncbi:MAG: hypothetical protein SGPRY_007854, partial [Prymnesium sp.]